VFNILSSAVKARLLFVAQGGRCRLVKGGRVSLCRLTWLGGVESARGDCELY
jgi:hypothetical protein